MQSKSSTRGDGVWHAFDRVHQLRSTAATGSAGAFLPRALNSLRGFLCAEPPTASSHRMGLCSWPSALEAGSTDICAMLRAADTGDLDAAGRHVKLADMSAASRCCLLADMSAASRCCRTELCQRIWFQKFEFDFGARYEVRDAAFICTPPHALVAN